MGVVDDLMKALDRIPIWKRLGEIPDEIDDLKRRVAELEEKLGGKWPADVCRYCGERAARLVGSWPDGNVNHEDWQCSKCNQLDNRSYRIGAR